MHDAQSASAAAQHRIDLGQAVDALAHGLEGQPQLLCQRLLRFRLGGQKLVQGRVQQANGDRAASHGREQTPKVVALKGQQPGERGATFAGVGGENHLAHDVDAAVVEEHVLGAAQADAFGAVDQPILRHARSVGVDAHGQLAELVGPGHHRSIPPIPRALLFRANAGQHLAHLRGGGGDLSGVDRAAAAVQGHGVAFAQHDVGHG